MTSKASSGATAENVEFYVGENSSMEGAEMAITGTARIDGRLSGKIYADHLIVGKTGFVSGEISGESAEVSGTIEQSVTLKKKLKVMSTGRVSGRISYGSIDIDEGATLIGELSTDSAEGDSGDRADNLARLSAVSSALGYTNVSRIVEGYESEEEDEDTGETGSADDAEDFDDDDEPRYAAGGDYTE